MAVARVDTLAPSRPRMVSDQHYIGHTVASSPDSELRWSQRIPANRPLQAPTFVQLCLLFGLVQNVILGVHHHSNVVDTVQCMEHLEPHGILAVVILMCSAYSWLRGITRNVEGGHCRRSSVRIDEYLSASTNSRASCPRLRPFLALVVQCSVARPLSIPSLRLRSRQ